MKDKQKTEHPSPIDPLPPYPLPTYPLIRPLPTFTSIWGHGLVCVFQKIFRKIPQIK